MVSWSLSTLMAVFAIEVNIFFDVGLRPLMAMPSSPCLACYCSNGLNIRPGYLHDIRLADIVIGQFGKFYRPKARCSSSSSWLAMLLLMSGVEANPGPSFSFGFLNSRSIVNKGPLIIELIDTHQLVAHHHSYERPLMIDFINTHQLVAHHHSYERPLIIDLINTHQLVAHHHSYERPLIIDLIDTHHSSSRIRSGSVAVLDVRVTDRQRHFRFRYPSFTVC